MAVCSSPACALPACACHHESMRCTNSSTTYTCWHKSLTHFILRNERCPAASGELSSPCPSDQLQADTFGRELSSAQAHPAARCWAVELPSPLSPIYPLSPLSPSQPAAPPVPAPHSTRPAPSLPLGGPSPVPWELTVGDTARIPK